MVGSKKLREGKGGSIDEEYEVTERKEQVERVVSVGLSSLECPAEVK